MNINELKNSSRREYRFCYELFDNYGGIADYKELLQEYPKKKLDLWRRKTLFLRKNFREARIELNFNPTIDDSKYIKWEIDDCFSTREVIYTCVYWHDIDVNSNIYSALEEREANFKQPVNWYSILYNRNRLPKEKSTARKEKIEIVEGLTT